MKQTLIRMSSEAVVDKSSRKKLKKERQRAKKVGAENIVLISTVDTTKHNQKIGKIIDTSKVNNKSIIEEKTMNSNQIVHENHDNDSDSNSDIDLSLANSAFVQSIMKQKCKSNKNTINNTEHSKKKHGTDNGNESNQSGGLKNDSKIPDDLQGYTIVAKDKATNKAINYDKTPEGWGIKGHKLILNRQKFQAACYLSKSIELNGFDIRHYINRSYCYLGTGDFVDALNDIKYVNSHTDDPLLLSKMKCREGQALWGMKNYDGAAECFKESLNFVPHCLAVQCEALRMKIVELTEMGFSERDVLEILHESPMIKVEEAVACLRNLGHDYCHDTNNPNVDDLESEVFLSDTEDCPSNTSLFMKAVNFDDEYEDNTWLDLIRTDNNTSSTKKVKKSESKPHELKVINTCGIPKVSSKKANITDKAVWVGNITPKITDAMLMKKFSQFGKVSSAFIPPGEKYAFVNFGQAGAAEKALAAEKIEIYGQSLPIKVAMTK